MHLLKVLSVKQHRLLSATCEHLWCWLAQQTAIPDFTGNSFLSLLLHCRNHLAERVCLVRIRALGQPSASHLRLRSHWVISDFHGLVAKVGADRLRHGRSCFPLRLQGRAQLGVGVPAILLRQIRFICALSGAHARIQHVTVLLH